jgi:hypothetical protein
LRLGRVGRHPVVIGSACASDFDPIVDAARSLPGGEVAR